MFGPDEDIPVHILKRTNVLHNLHFDLLTILEKETVRIRHPEWHGRNYTPHITIKASRPLPIGAIHVSRRLYLSEVLRNGERFIHGIAEFA